jgi:hypothetical protein
LADVPSSSTLTSGVLCENQPPALHMSMVRKPNQAQGSVQL